MIKPVLTDQEWLAKISTALEKDDPLLPVILENLLETAEYHRGTKIGCVGLAASQIGYLRRAIVVWLGHWVVMINPVVTPRTVRKGAGYEACLSRPGVSRQMLRYKRIQVSAEKTTGEMFTLKLAGWQARIVQHEVDHLDGKYI